MLSDRLGQLIQQAWDAHSEVAQFQCLVGQSIPILYFGDADAYSSSKIKIVTVGLNPSNVEFPVKGDDTMSRFTKAAHLVETGFTGTSDDVQAHVSALNQYFQAEPYTKWFNGAYRAILNGLSASFYGDTHNTALHTDICSPAATLPTWSKLAGKLKTEDRRKIERTGLDLWQELMETLEPDVALISVKWEYVGNIEFDSPTPWERIRTVQRQNPYHVLASRRKFRSGKSCLFVFGRAAQLPFGTLSGEQRKWVGQQIAEEVFGG